MRETDSADLAAHHHFVQVSVSLAAYEEGQHVITEVIELILADTATSGIVSQEPEQEGPLILVVPLLGAQRKRKVRTTVELSVYPPVAPIAQAHTIACLECAPWIKYLPYDVMRLNVFGRIATNAATEITRLDVTAP
jgi:hypothetical protein